MNNYTFIFFLPSYDDYCRGCHMGSWHEEFEIEVDLDEIDLERKWIDTLVECHKNTSPADPQITILKNGRPMYSDDSSIHVQTNWTYSKEYFELEEEAESTGNYEALEQAEINWNQNKDDFMTLKKQVEEKALKIIEEKIAEKKKIEQQKQLEKKEKEKELRKLKFEQLKQEFDGKYVD